MHVLELIVPLFIIIFIGYALRKTGFVREGFVDELNRLVYFIGLPALLFSESSGINPAELTGGAAGIAYPIIVAATALMALLASMLLPYSHRGSVVQAGFRSNLAYLGLPIVSTTLGEAVLGTIAIIIAAGVVTNTLLAILVLSFLKPGGEDIRPLRRLAGLVTNPLLISIAAGLLVAASGLELPRMVARPIELLARMSLPLILLVLGLSLSFTDLRRNLPTAALAAALKLVAMPAIAWMVSFGLFGAPAETANSVVLMAAMPTAIATQSFAKAFDADSAVSASSVSLSTLLAVVTVPALVVLLGV